MIKRLAIPTVMAFTWIATIASPAQACSCGLIDMEGAIDNSDAVFLGEIVDQEPDTAGPTLLHPLRWLDLRVIQSWKGVTGTEVRVFTEPGGSIAGCGLYGRTGDLTLLFADRGGHSGYLEVPVCSWISGYYLEESLAELAALGIDALELIEGLDPNYARTTGFLGLGLCGAGILPAMFVCLAAFSVSIARRRRSR